MANCNALIPFTHRGNCRVPLLNLRQLRSLCEIVDCGLHVSAAATSLHRSQPGLTRQIKDIENEIGTQIFVRKKNRLIELTPQGKEIIAIARRILQDTANIRSIGHEQQGTATGELRLVTTHTHARYTLPRLIRQFMATYPHVKLNLRQGDPPQCFDLVDRGLADIAICGEIRNCPEDVVQLPCYRMNRAILTPPRHPLLRAAPVTLEHIARYPLITYDETFGGRRTIDAAFAARGLTPSVVISAADAEIGKSYVEMNVGIAILPTIVFDKKSDAKLRRIDASHLFAPTTVRFVFRRNAYLRGYAVAFMQLFAPQVGKDQIFAALSGTASPAPHETLPFI